jgi:tetratricopeptide (TPR) repeat protein
MDPNKPSLPSSGWGLALERAPQFLSVTLLFSVPLLVQAGGMDPLFPKGAVAQLLISLMLVAWVLRMAVTGRAVWTDSKAHRVFLLLALWLPASLAFSPHPAACLPRLLDFAVFPLWYLLLTFTCLEAWQGENLLIVFLASGWVTCLWALDQAWGSPGGGWAAWVREKFSGRPAAGMGSPGSLAGFLLLVWPLALALFMRAEKPFSKGFWGFLFVACLFTLGETGSPAGWAGFAAGALVFVFLLRREGGRKVPMEAYALALFLLVTAFLPPLSSRFQAVWGSGEILSRFDREVWSGAAAMVASHPVFGVGFGGFPSAFPRFRTASLMIHDPGEGYQVAGTGNGLLEWTAETGLPGLLLLAAFWFWVLAQWWKLYRANAIPRVLGAAVFAAFAAEGVDLFFGFDDPHSALLVPLLFLAAFPVALSHRFTHMEGFPIRLRQADLSRWKPLVLAALALAGIFCYGRTESAFRGQRAQVEWKKGDQAVKAGDWDGALGYLRGALDSDPGNISILYDEGSTLLDRGKPGDLEKALADFQAVGQTSPDYRLLHYEKYEALRGLGRVDEAAAEMERAVRLDPGLVYLLDDFKKAKELTAAGRYSQALIVYQNLFLDYPTCVPLLVSFANCLALGHDFVSAVNLYRKVLDLDPGNPKALSDLAKVREVMRRENQVKTRGNILGGELQ